MKQIKISIKLNSNPMSTKKITTEKHFIPHSFFWKNYNGFGPNLHSRHAAY
jgi:hypothetical protein